jgi:hypothetical protein
MLTYASGVGTHLLPQQVSKEKKLTPQQKKAEKMQAKGSMQVGPSPIKGSIA